MWENARRDRVGEPEGYEHAYDDDITDMKVCVCCSSCASGTLTGLTLHRTPNSDILSKGLPWTCLRTLLTFVQRRLAEHHLRTCVV